LVARRGDGVSDHRSRGSILLAQTGRTQEEIAARAKCSKALAGHWLTGARKPTKKGRTLLKRAYKIPLPAWDEAPPREPHTPMATPLTPEEAWQGLLKSANAAIVQAADPNKSASERARLAKFARDTLAGYEARGDISEAQIIKTASFRRMLDVIVEELAKYPDAFVEITRRLAELAAE